jgi:hypothetical protein
LEAKVAPLGWFQTQFGTDEHTFSVGGVFEVAIDDTGSTEARVRGFSSSSSSGVAEASGSDPFPLDTSVSGGLYIQKSVTADGTARAWSAFSNGSYLHFVIEVDSGVQIRYGVGQVAGGGACTIEANESAAIETDPDTHKLSLATTPGVYVLFNIDGTTPAGNPGRASMLPSGPRFGGSGFAYPYQTGGILIDRIYLYDADTSYGPTWLIPGLWNVMHNRPITNGDIFNGTLQSRDFEYFDGNSTNASSFVLETSQTWEGGIY